MREQKHFETVEDLVKFVIGNPTNASCRWGLDSQTCSAWDDPIAGRKWRDERSQLKYCWSGDPGYAEYVEKDTQLFDRKPSEHKQTTWTLIETSPVGSWHHNHYSLSEQLGEVLSDIWTEKLSRYSPRMERIGRLSIPGMLKRLGMTGLKKQIKDAQTKIDNEQAKRKRNNIRIRARELAVRLLELRQSYPEILLSDSLAALATVENES